MLEPQKEPVTSATDVDFLGTMARSSKERADLALHEAPLSEWQAKARDQKPPLPLDTKKEGFRLICEVKFRSPAEGALQTSSPSEAVRRAESYARAGASAISVLTEPTRFGGSLNDLERVAQGVQVPCMRKDFLVHPVQVYEARARGASGVLLITRMVTDERLTELLEAIAATNQFCLVEAFDEEDLVRSERVLSQAAPSTTCWVGVNSRNLETLQVDRTRLFQLAPKLPEGYVTVAESGLATPQDAEELAQAGYDAALVGSALMKSDDPEALAQGLLQAGTRGCAQRSVLDGGQLG